MCVWGDLFPVSCSFFMFLFPVPDPVSISVPVSIYFPFYVSVSVMFLLFSSFPFCSIPSFPISFLIFKRMAGGERHFSFLVAGGIARDIGW